MFSEKSNFQYSYVNDLGPRSINDLNIQYSHTIINLIGCLNLASFRLLAAKVSEKSTVFTFSSRKVELAKFDLAVK